MRRIVAAAALLTLALLLAPETAATTATEHGYASAYAPGVFEATVAYRVEHDVWRVDPPDNWQTAEGFVAAMDCSRVGESATLVTPADGRAYRVLIADCAGADGPPDRFSKLGIIVELDAELWERLTAIHGRPLEVELWPGWMQYERKWGIDSWQMKNGAQ